MKHPFLACWLWLSAGAIGLWLPPHAWWYEVGAALCFLNAGIIIGERVRR